MSSVLEQLAPSVKKLSPQRKRFLEEYVASGYDKKVAAKRAGYAEHYGSTLCYLLKNEILEIIEGKLISDGVKAAQVLSDMLTTDQPIKNAAQKLESAKTVLDRIGLAKRERIDINQEVKHGVFVLPAKAPSKTYEGEIVDVEEARKINEG